MEESSRWVDPQKDGELIEDGHQGLSGIYRDEGLRVSFSYVNSADIDFQENGSYYILWSLNRVYELRNGGVKLGLKRGLRERAMPLLPEPYGFPYCPPTLKQF